ncbi:hypothetical protein VTK73DRAFT_2813 [Phialemonium thermophilum]|uniref:Cytochrome P450 n=1 Tax=Phialemonium thermophilum TaxID=223376 RepID=A0ABR3VPS2_9PEZI
MAVTILSIPLGYVALAAVWAIVLYHIVRSKRAGLDHIPGPFLARYTDAWRAYQAWKTNHYAGGHNYQTRLLGKYGDVVRIGPNTVLVLDPEAINSVLGFKERLEKGPGYQVFVLPGESPSPFLSPGVRTVLMLLTGTQRHDADRAGRYQGRGHARQVPPPHRQLLLAVVAQGLRALHRRHDPRPDRRARPARPRRQAHQHEPLSAFL